MTALKFAELAAKAGFPKGVINIVPGSGILDGRQSVVSLMRGTESANLLIVCFLFVSQVIFCNFLY